MGDAARQILSRHSKKIDHFLSRRICGPSGSISPETMVATMDCTGDIENYISFSVSQDSEEDDIVGNFFEGTKSVRNIG
jgi:hypothetical protein